MTRYQAIPLLLGALVAIAAIGLSVDDFDPSYDLVPAVAVTLLLVSPYLTLSYVARSARPVAWGLALSAVLLGTVAFFWFATRGPMGGVVIGVIMPPQLVAVAVASKDRFRRSRDPSREGSPTPTGLLE